MFQQSILVQLASEPISDAFPEGKDLRNEELFDTLHSEVNKQQSLYDDEEPDWTMVLDESLKVLEKQSKDLRVAVWILRALSHIEGVDGLLKGLVTLDALQQAWWPVLFPLRSSSRARTLHPIVPLITSTVKDFIITPQNREQAVQLEACLGKLDAFYDEKLNDDAPLLSSVCHDLKNRIRQAGTVSQPVNAETEKKKREESSDNQADHQKTALNRESIQTDDDARDALSAMKKQGYALTGFWLEKDPSLPRIYLMNRTLSWVDVSLPSGGHQLFISKKQRSQIEDDNRQRTSMLSVPEEKRIKFRRYLENENYSRLIRELEPYLHKHPFWIDGHYLVWKSLQALEMTEAAQAVCDQLAFFVGRYPEIVERTFSDDTPFASEQTRQWISLHVSAEDPPEDIVPDIADDVSDSPWEKGLQDALECAKNEGFSEAIAGLTEGARRTTGERERFMWQLVQARFCFQMHKYDIAAHLLEGLDAVMDKHNLAQWEPGLSASVLKLRCQCMDRLDEKSVMPQIREQVYKRLCHMDLGLALS